MILSITDGIEVAEHTEPQERAMFLHIFRLVKDWRESYTTLYVAGDWPVTVSDHQACALMARQAE